MGGVELNNTGGGVTCEPCGHTGWSSPLTRANDSMLTVCICLPALKGESCVGRKDWQPCRLETAACSPCNQKQKRIKIRFAMQMNQAVILPEPPPPGIKTTLHNLLFGPLVWIIALDHCRHFCSGKQGPEMLTQLCRSFNWAY